MSGHRSILREAMLALFEQLSDLELDFENTLEAARRSDGPRQKRGLTKLAATYERRLNLLRPFFDWNVCHDDRVSA